MTKDRTRVIARLARWLGPWTSEHARPANVLRRSVSVEGRFPAWVYRPREEPLGSILVVPGLHYLGPADPRLDRFLAILADAGLLVLCPFLPEFRRLRVGPALEADVRAAHDTLLALPDRPRGAEPGVFSISFGSYHAISLAARRQVPALVVFGGYANFEDAIRFALEGEPGRPHDPLNRPVIYLNLLEHLGELPERELIAGAWAEYVRRSWGRPRMKQEARWRGLATSIADRLPARAREPFLLGTGALPGSTDFALAALERGRAGLAHLDPMGACEKVRARVTIVHGRDDDVIPYTHARVLAEAMRSSARARVHLTGLYSHTGHASLGPRALAGEVRAMLGILEAIADAGVGADSKR